MKTLYNIKIITPAGIIKVYEKEYLEVGLKIKALYADKEGFKVEIVEC